MQLFYKKHIQNFFLLSDFQDTKPNPQNWRVSALRIILASVFLLCFFVVIHSSSQAIAVGSYKAPIISGIFYLILCLLLWQSKKNYYYSVYGLLFSVVAAALSISLFVTDRNLQNLGPIFLYGLPILAMMLLSIRIGLCIIFFGFVPFYLLIQNIHLADFFNINTIALPQANFYINALVFLFFNVCIPLTIARASLAAQRLYKQVNEKNVVLENNNQLYRSLFIEASIPKFIVDESGHISDVNIAAINILGYQPNSIQAVKYQEIFPDIDMAQDQALLNKKVDGKLKTYRLTRQDMTSSYSHHILYTMEDISAKTLLRKTLNAHSMQINRHKHIDLYTDLPNRVWLETKLSELIKTKQVPIMLISIRVSNAHFIQQKYGTDALHKSLKFSAMNISNLLNEDCYLAAIDSTSFAAAIPNYSQQDKDVFFEDIIKLLPKYMIFDEHKLSLDIKLGVSFLLENQLGIDRYINNAVHAAVSGTEIVNFYTDTVQQQYIEHEEINILLNDAIDNNELFIFYQPKVALANEEDKAKLIGFEALLRWNSPLLGSVSPAKFIKIAEQSGLIVKLTRWLITNVCQQLHDWQVRELNTVSVAINISGIDLDQKDFHQFLLSNMASYEISPKLIELELTESALTQDIEAAVNITEYLTELGFCITLDDFGVGYSGLSKLTTFPVKRVKIDRQFVKDIDIDNNKVKFIEAIIAMCRVFNIPILAEGVEKMSEVKRLTSLGCTHFQGFVFSKPLSAVDAQLWLENKMPIDVNKSKRLESQEQ